MKKAVLGGGSFQVLLTGLAAFTLAKYFGIAFGEAVFIGFLVALSSTAIVLKLIQERAEVDSPHGRTTLGILIFQDVIIVPMILVTPLLAGVSGNIDGSPLVFISKGIGIILLLVVCAKWVVPQVLYQIVRTRNTELFLLSIVVICLAVAWGTHSAGLSLALGAFLAGLIVSESEYSHQALGHILPFKDVFTSFFFVSIGMLLDVRLLFLHPLLIVIITLCVLVIKSAIAGFVSLLLGFPLRVAVLVGLALSQVGEFSFILSKTGVEYNLLTGDTYQIFLSFSVLTMAATPFIIALAPRMADFILRLPLPEKLKSGLHPIQETKTPGKRDHLIIIGFGVNGTNLARAARAGGIPYVIIEMNPETVRREQAMGEPISYGDATHEAVFRHANVKDARIVVVAINDPAATRRITEVVRKLNPTVYLIVRTRYLQEMEALYELEADEVIPEEFETSVEIFTRVMTKYLVPKDVIGRFVAEVRSDGYEMFRSLDKKPASFSDMKLRLPGVEISTLRVSENTPVVGKSLAQIELRKKYGVTVLAIRRDTQILSNPSGGMQFCADDDLFILGPPEKIALVTGLFHNPKKEEQADESVSNGSDKQNFAP
jgi:CPA2 family monovalent cation:H+ antiporter-2